MYGVQSYIVSGRKTDNLHEIYGSPGSHYFHRMLGVQATWLSDSTFNGLEDVLEVDANAAQSIGWHRRSAILGDQPATSMHEQI